MSVSEFQEIVDDFEILDDWEDKYRYIIDLGKKISPLEDFQKNTTTKVEGCASQVWLTYDLIEKGSSKSILLKGDSDALIVKGLIAIILTLFNGVEVNECRTINASIELAKLGLQEHLSSQRSNGLRAMINKIGAITDNL